MSYTLLARTAADATWQGASAYTLLDRAAADATWQTGEPPGPSPIGIIAAGTRARWRDATRHQTRARLPWAAYQRLGAETRLPWADATRAGAETRLPWREPQRTGIETRIPVGEALRTGTETRLPWQSLSPSRPLTRLPWTDARRLARQTTRYRPEPIRTGIEFRLPWRGGARIVLRYHVPWRDAHLVGRLTRIPWRDARRPYARGPVPPGPIIPPIVRIIGELNFRCLVETQILDFGRICLGGAAYLVPIRRVYPVTNSASLTRLIDGEPIPAVVVEMSIDLASWVWSASAELPDIAAGTLLASNPTEVEAVINGYTWRALLERPATSRGFIDQTARAVGSSLAGYLGAPYARARSRIENTTKTAQQLALDELPVGWSLEWNIDDWTVPGGTFSYSELHPIEAIQRIAAAAGAVVQADPVAQRLIVQRRWPVAPWDWPGEVADGTLPVDYLDTESIAVHAGRDYNAVIVHGVEPNGVLARVRRDGTAGDRAAPDVSDPLLTDTLPVRYRGIQVLADSRTHRRATLVMDLAAAPVGAGLILPGTLLDIDDGLDGYRCLTTGCRVSARVEGDGFLDVIQLVEVVIDG